MRRGFTILELLVTIGLILLLASLVIVALGGVRAAATRSQTSAALRQMSLAYNSYHTDSKGVLMPGYVDEPMLGALGLKAKLKDNTVLDPGDALGYVWRLAPYMDYDWRVMFTDYQNKDLLTELVLEVNSGCYGPGSLSPDCVLGLSRLPSFGLNSIFLGGDNVHGGGSVTARNPWTPSDPATVLAATRYTEVLNPARIVVFGPVVYWTEQDGNPGNDLIPNAPVARVEFGYPELRAPMLGWDDNRDPIEPQWEVSSGMIQKDSSASFDDGGGWPISRWGTDEVPVGHLDGSVTTERILDLQKDLRFWKPFGL